MSSTQTSKILRMNPRIFMVWIFMISISMIFVSLISAYIVKKGEPGTIIEFIGPGGEVVKTVRGYSAKCEAKDAYIRAKVTHRVKNKDGSLREYYAWTQPVFTDGR